MSDTAQDTKSPLRGFLLANMIKYAEGCVFVHIYQRNPQRGSNNTQYKELLSSMFVFNFYP